MTTEPIAYHSGNIDWQPRLAHIRGMAALLVFVFHVYHRYYGAWQPHTANSLFGWVTEGHTGVGLFFVLSGFLFMRIAQRAKGILRYGGFLRNRVLRIMPLFLVFFFVAISIGREAFRPADILYVLFSNLGLAPTSAQFMTGAAWTISIEFTFYMIFPFLARFVYAEGIGYVAKVVFLLLLLKTGAFLVSQAPTHMLYSTLLGRFDQFLIGMGAAVFFVQMLSWKTKWVLSSRFFWWFFPVSVLGMVVLLGGLAKWASFFLPEKAQVFWVVWPTLEAIGWGSVIMSYSLWPGNVPAWLNRFAERLGELSFSFYLWHGLVIFLVQQVWVSPVITGVRALDIIPLAVALFALTWMVSSLSYQTIEAPFLRLRGEYRA